MLGKKFVKKYCNIAEIITNAMKGYVAEVKGGIFPDEDRYCYHMVEGEEEKFLQIVKEQFSATEGAGY